jgi:hypothetical protein
MVAAAYTSGIHAARQHRQPPAKEDSMPRIQLRITGDRDVFDDVMTAIHGIDRIERVEEVDDFMSDFRDDSSSQNLSDDMSSRTYTLEVEVPNDKIGERVREIAEETAGTREAAIEFIGPDENEV